MNRKILLILFGFTLLGACSSATSQSDNPTIFPKGKESWVGDPMPYFDGKSFRVFYLEDLRNGEIGFHPWSLMSTENFLEYSNEGEVIPFVNETSSQERALGTGSVIKDRNGIYHAYYTAHNGSLSPKEAIMHATSRDLKNWTKLPKDTFFGSDQYEKDDFRDPYVLYNEEVQEYWMLITTRKDGMGVIALYTSADLKTWEDQGVFFQNDMGTDSNLECPTLISFNGYWYLTFSDQWPDRVVHYRIARKSDGNFKKPELDHFDGSGYYAGRLEKDQDNLYMFGWVPTRTGYDDMQNYDWAGNLVVHQLNQREGGELFPSVPETINQHLLSREPLTVTKKTEKVQVKGENYKFAGSGYEFAAFEKLEGTEKITGKISTGIKNKQFGFMFAPDESGNSQLNILFNAETQQLEFYNTNLGQIDFIKPQSVMPLKIGKQSELEFTLLTEDTVAVLYINDQIAFSTRMFSMKSQEWGIFSNSSDVHVEDLKITR